MNIEFEASFLFANHTKLSDEITRLFNQKYNMTKTAPEVKLLENEVVFLKIQGSKIKQRNNKFVNNKHEKLNEGRIIRKNVVEENLDNVLVYITNKYLHLVFSDNSKTVNIKNIIKVAIDLQKIIIYTDSKSYTIITNDYKVGTQIALILDLVKNINVNDSHVGKSINLGIK